MEKEIPTRLSIGEARRFAYTVGGAFVLFGLISWARAQQSAAIALTGTGLILCLLGLSIPGRLTPIWRAWMGVARVLSKVTAPILMGLIYAIAFVPIGVARRLCGRNSLVHRAGAEGYWVRIDSKQAVSGNLERQF